MTIEELLKDPALRAEIAADEGKRTHPYLDTVGRWTGGIGHNLTAHAVEWTQISGWKQTGIPEATIGDWFNKDLSAAIEACVSVFDGFADLPDEAQRVLANMAFDLMYGLEKWPNLIKHVEQGSWKSAAADILASGFARQAPSRCKRLAARMASVS